MQSLRNFITLRRSTTPEIISPPQYHNIPSYNLRRDPVFVAEIEYTRVPSPLCLGSDSVDEAYVNLGVERESAEYCNHHQPEQVVRLPTDVSGEEVLNILQEVLPAETYRQMADRISRLPPNTRVSEWLQNQTFSETSDSDSSVIMENSSTSGTSLSLPSSAGALAEQTGTNATQEFAGVQHANGEDFDGFINPIEEGRSVDTQGRPVIVIRYPTDSQSDVDRAAVPSVPSLFESTAQTPPSVEEDVLDEEFLEFLKSRLENRGTN